ncbi:hypothetical protein SNE40_009998 [Patella caerulea]|uniref:Transmembrane protein 62 n=1 Tax=Patella caerulea TaxID=87958 RepID=A0AAN8JQR5_PATCE
MKFISLVLGVLVFFGIILSLFFDFLNPDSLTGEDDSQVYQSQVETGQSLSDENKNLFWFIQITDLHISKFKDFQRGPDLIEFCKSQLSIIKPELVITTGDLVDAKLPDFVSSTQFIEEWVEYKKILQICEEYTTAKWLDIRGNHDAFDVPDLESPRNYYREYSKQGPNHLTSYSYTHTTKYGKYSFIGVDACPDPGPKRPFNFFGQLNTDKLNDLAKLSEEKKDSNLTIWFGHYPTSVIVEDPPGIKHVMRKGVVYLCGHLHTLLGLVPSMYTRQKTGTLELELGDWRDNRMYRLLAVDNDLLSFVDMKISDWPVVLITNPKNSQYQNGRHEPLHIMKTSTHIRFLVFSNGDITSAIVSIDDTKLGSAQNTDGPLYTIAWDPSRYTKNMHIISVVVTDSLGNKREVKQPFSLDGSTTTGFGFLPRLILMLNISVVGKMWFGGFVFFLTFFLTSLRQCGNIRRYFLEGEGKICYIFNIWMFKLWLTSRTNFTYYATIGFILYVTFGPWFIGDLLGEYTGCVFVWGIFIKDTFLPASITYFYGIFQLMTFNIPLMLITSHILDIRSRQRSKNIIQSNTHLIIPFIILLLFQSYLAYREFPTAYGTKALVMGPVRTGSIIYGLIVYYYAHQIRINDGKNPSSCSSS